MSPYGEGRGEWSCVKNHAIEYATLSHLSDMVKDDNTTNHSISQEAYYGGGIF